MSKVNLISQADYAKHRGCSEAAVSKAIKANRISLIDGKIDPAVADMQWKRNSRARVDSGQRRGQPAAGDRTPVHGTGDSGSTGDDKPGGADYWESRARREAAEAELAELSLGEKRAELVRKADVDRAAYTAARAMRDGLTNCARRLGAACAVLSTPGECAAIIELEHRHLLTSWSKVFGSLPPAAIEPQESAPS